MHRSSLARVARLTAAVLFVSLVAAQTAAAAPLVRPGGPFTYAGRLGSLPAPAAVAAGRTTTYAGSTSPGLTPMIMEVRKSRIGRIAVMYNTSDFAYDSVLPASALRRAKIGRGGRFSLSVRTSLVDSQRVWWSGERQPDQIVEKFTGKIGKRSARGTVRATLSFLDGTKATSGTQRWLLTHKPARVFGGLTSQSMPVSVELSSKGTRINHLHIGWVAPTTNGGVWVLPDFLTNFTLAGGQVSEAFQQEYTDPDGGVLRYEYQITARTGRTTSTGSLHVKVSSVDAAGTVTELCATPTISWTARS